MRRIIHYIILLTPLILTGQRAIIQETDCDGQNLVTIAYEAERDCFAEIFMHIAGEEFTPVYAGPFVSFIGISDDRGSITAGYHTYDWFLDADYPGYEGELFCRVVMRDDICCGGSPLTPSGSVPEMLIAGNYYDTDFRLLDPDINYVEGERMGFHTWDRHFTIEDTTISGVFDPGYFNFSTELGWPTFTQGYVHFNICSPEDTTIYLEIRVDDDIRVWQDGEVIFVDSDRDANIRVADPHIVPVTLRGCSWSSFYFGITNYLWDTALSFRFSDAVGDPVDWISYSLDPISEYSFIDTLEFTGFVDSRPPGLTLNCPVMPFQAGVPGRFSWSFLDVSGIALPCSVSLNCCDGDVSWLQDTNAVFYTPTVGPCESCSLFVTVCDSFCNCVTEYCDFWVEEAADTVDTVYIDSVWFAEERDCDGVNTVEICYSMTGGTATIRPGLCIEDSLVWIPAGDSLFATFSDDDDDFGPDVGPGLHCFNWHLSVDMPDFERDSCLIRIAAASNMPVVDSFSILDSTAYTINGNDGFVDPDSGYLVLTQDRTWRNGRIITVDSVYTDTVTVGYRFKLSTTGSRGADGVGLIFSRYPDPPLAFGGQLGISQNDGWGIAVDTWENCCDIDGNHIELSVADTCCLAGSQPIPTPLEQIPLAEELVDNMWHYVYIEVNYPDIKVRFDGRTYINGSYPEIEPFWGFIGFSASTGSAHSSHIIDDFSIFSPDMESVTIETIAHGPLDSRPPDIDILSMPDTALAGTDITIDWSTSDLHPGYPDGWTRMVLIQQDAGTDTIFDPTIPTILTVPPTSRDSIVIVLVARDSFCNVNEITAILPVWNPDYSASPVNPLPGEVTACPLQETVIRITEPDRIDWNSLFLTVEDIVYPMDAPEIATSGDTLVFTPPLAYDHGQQVNVMLIRRLNTLSLVLLNYSFLADLTPPVISLLSPDSGGVSNDNTPEIVLSLTDDMTPVDLSDAEVIVGGHVLDIPHTAPTLEIELRFNTDDLSFPSGDSIFIDVTNIVDSPDLCVPNIGSTRFFFFTPSTGCESWPNPFSPDGDGFNDRVHFRFADQEQTPSKIAVFNKRKEEVWRSTLTPSIGAFDPLRTWDGRDGSGTQLPQGMYIYIITQGKEVICQGTVTLVR